MLHLVGRYLWERLLQSLHDHRNRFCLILGFQHTNLAFCLANHVTGTEHVCRR